MLRYEGRTFIPCWLTWVSASTSFYYLLCFFNYCSVLVFNWRLYFRKRIKELACFRVGGFLLWAFPPCQKNRDRRFPMIESRSVCRLKDVALVLSLFEVFKSKPPQVANTRASKLEVVSDLLLLLFLAFLHSLY